jgi:hypothetical protein
MRRFSWLSILAFALVGSPFLAHAASTLQPIIQLGGTCACPGSAPDWGCVLQTVQIVMNDIVAFATILITIFIAWAGFGFILSPTSAEGRTKARNRLVNAVLGLLIVLAAWLLIDSFLKVIYNSGATATGLTTTLGPWYSLLSDSGGDQCIKTVTNIPALPSLLSGGNAGGSNPNATPTGTPSAPSGTCGANTHLNCTATVSYLDSHAGATDNGKCLTSIQLALEAGGLPLLKCPATNGSSSNWAGQCSPALHADGFTSLGSSDSSPQAGDVVVITHTTGNQIGHIAMYDGSSWVSDFVQSNSEQPPGNPYSSGFGGAAYWRP